MSDSNLFIMAGLIIGGLILLSLPYQNQEKKEHFGEETEEQKRSREEYYRVCVIKKADL